MMMLAAFVATESFTPTVGLHVVNSSTLVGFIDLHK
jgi:hypothetical protein